MTTQHSSSGQCFGSTIGGEGEAGGEGEGGGGEGGGGEGGGGDGGGEGGGSEGGGSGGGEGGDGGEQLSDVQMYLLPMLQPVLQQFVTSSALQRRAPCAAHSASASS